MATCIASLVWHALLGLLWRVHPAFTRWPLVLVPTLGALAVIVVMIWLLCRWAATSTWNDRHRLALVIGALLSHSLFGAAILTKTMVDRAGVAVLILVTVVLLILFASKVRYRTRRQGGDPDGAEISQL